MALLNTSSTFLLTTDIHPSRTPISPTVSFTIRASSSSVSISNSNGSSKAMFGSSTSRGGAGVLERPSFDQSQFDPATQVQEGGDIGRVRDKKHTGSGDSYRVLLIDDARHTEELVVKALPQAVPAVTADDARRLFQVSQENGVAVVVVAVKEHAEFYAQMMMRKGLRSTIEPDSATV
ncbi:ATP-dependent Clp protease adapter protein CLPS1, chloroplastic-like [Cynara cardunculus var. scolymus]|uniref:Adaptor protein ClpS, core n=1 Tax=Cynara cardunculus var. scolymus TaxID=59895 RepID=A0A103XRY1_CYNCS|nr:ATP-dependent Clp protease adapter protein CLPS1, chloroplastic-like [Cynara cardunculus var. scolymus]KVH95764.1 Adaptor protein ClpS, core [Cynara cardunculus var. scolymus]